MTTATVVAVDMAKPSAPARWRVITSRILVAMFCLSTVLSVLATWARFQIDDTDRYVRTVAPLASDPAIQAAVSTRVSTEISGFLNDLVTREGLIDGPGFLSG